MKFFFICCLLLICSHFANACSAAYQYSLFPLGASMGQIVLLELEMDRYVKTPENKIMQFGGRSRFEEEYDDAEEIEVRWKGTIKLYQLIDGKMTLIEDLGFTDLSDKKYKEALQPYFLEAMEKARSLPLFEVATLQNMGICHYDRSCTFFEKILDTENLKFYCKSKEKGYENDSVLVAYPYKILVKAENELKTKITQLDSLEAQMQIDFFRVWSPQNVRRYDIGGKTVQVFTLGRGIKSKYTLKKREAWEKINLEGIEYFIQGNDVVYHGQRFDFIQIL
jgi:hypothetical protein